MAGLPRHPRSIRGGPLSGRFWPRSVGASGGVTLGSTGVRIGAVTFEAGELPERLFATTENA